MIGFDGNKDKWGLMGWCYYPDSPDYTYDSFMKVVAVTDKHNPTLAHEFGHGMGLYHLFNGIETIYSTISQTDCPVDDDCTRDNDAVCDTEPTANLLSVSPTPTNDSINVCTGNKYNGVQYNVMNYTPQIRKFTPGQRNRALQVFLWLREDLTKSKAAMPLENEESNIILVPACIPPNGPAENTGYGMGHVSVELRNIPKISFANDTVLPNYYDDFTKMSCLDAFVYTDIPKDESSDLFISIRANDPSNEQYVKAWIRL